MHKSLGYTGEYVIVAKITLNIGFDSRVLGHIESRHLDLHLPLVKLVNDLNQTEANQIIKGGLRTVFRFESPLPFPIRERAHPTA